MGLASALSTALTGLNAAETTIDVVGNNLANSNTVGFKASTANFATQFLQTRSLGSAPTDFSGGTNPRQIGLGTMVADITPNFNQGTIEISSSPTDLAIQGDGFFIVQGASSEEEFYTRNGIFKLNSENQLTTVMGNRLLGYTVNDQFELQQSDNLQPIDIPLGSEAVAAATQNVHLEGSLTPTADVATAAEIIETQPLSDASHSRPDVATAATTAAASIKPSTVGSSAAVAAGGTLATGTYRYKITFAGDSFAVDPTNESILSDVVTGPIAVDAMTPNRTVDLTSLANAADYSYFRVYRSTDGGDYRYIDEVDYSGGPVTSFSDNGLADGPAFDTNTLSNFSYTYYITFTNGTQESRPSEPIRDVQVDDGGRIKLTDLPSEPPAGPDGWNARRIYRNVASDSSAFYLVAEIGDIDTTNTFTDSYSDADLVANDEPIDFTGWAIGYGTDLIDIQRWNGDSYQQVFQEGDLTFTGRKGGRTLTPKTLEIASDTKVSQLLDFMEQAMGIALRSGSSSVNEPPVDPASGQAPGGYVEGGKIRFISNNGLDNAAAIGLSGLQMETSGGTSVVSLPFSSVQTAVGQGAVTDFLVYDSLGTKLQVRLTTELEERTSERTTYRWYADCGENSPATGVGISVGTGRIYFGGEGKFLSATSDTVSIYREDMPSVSPLEFKLDFSQISGLATDKSSLAVTRQDGSAAGTLTSFMIGEDGVVRGVFSNGITQDLGQVVLARFANPAGMEQKGENLFSTGVNSGNAVRKPPGESGNGTIIAGAVELSNTDIGGNLIDLILASTMYRGNTRVITTAQQMLDELLNLRR